jgi:uncharacterized protein YndB with AHSA1/START domain
MEKLKLNMELVSSPSISIDSNAEMIWETLTNPNLISQYLFGAKTETDWKVGSDILFKIAVENTEFIDKGIVIENIPNEKLEYKYWSGLRS